MKVIQLNAWSFEYFNVMLEFLKQEKPDIINLQEVSVANSHHTGDQNISPFEVLKKELNMQGYFAPWIGIHHQGVTVGHFGNAFLTNLEIIDYGNFFEKTLPDYFIREETKEHTEASKNKEYFHFFEEPKNYVWSVLKYKGKLVRNITTHYTVSYKCTETIQMINQTRSVINYLENVKPLPTIFSGDLNIHDKSSSIAMLSKHLGMVNSDIKNTLNPTVHPIFNSRSDSPNGIKVDYIFEKGFEVIKCVSPTVNISDHLPVIAEMDILS